MNEITRILAGLEAGIPYTSEQLLPLVYDELRRLASEKLAREKPGQTLQATALVHEAYSRLVDPQRVKHWNSRGHFFLAAAEAMRRILVENARRKHSQKQGGGKRRVDLAEDPAAPDDSPEEVLAVHEALEKLAREDPAKARLVELRYFAGLSVQEAADAMGISRATADRYWAFAKVWLYCEMTGDSQGQSEEKGRTP